MIAIFRRAQDEELRKPVGTVHWKYNTGAHFRRPHSAALYEPMKGDFKQTTAECAWVKIVVRDRRAV